MTVLHLPLYWNPNDHEYSRPYVPFLAVDCARRRVRAYVEAGGWQLEDTWEFDAGVIGHKFRLGVSPYLTSDELSELLKEVRSVVAEAPSDACAEHLLRDVERVVGELGAGADGAIPSFSVWDWLPVDWAHDIELDDMLERDASQEEVSEWLAQQKEEFIDHWSPCAIEFDWDAEVAEWLANYRQSWEESASDD